MRPPRSSDRPRAEARLLAALLAAAAPLAARALDAAAPGAGGTLRITAEPPRLLLGRDAGAELRIQAPPEVEELSLLPSVGRVEGVRRLPGGGFAARYRPPPERSPQVAIVAALGRTPRGIADGWLAIPLSGQGEARVRAAPGTEITLRIGESTFGPRRADAQGVAVLPVVVPPGVREAHHGFRPVDLKVPERSLVHAVADRSAVRADRLEHVRVFAYVVAPHGAARRGDVPEVEVSRGSVTLTAREPGAFEAHWSLPPGAAGEDRLVVRLPGSAVSRAVLRLDAIAGPATTVAVAFDREALEAGSPEPPTVTARVLDAAGNPVAAPVELAADGGALSSPAPAGPGAVTARLVVAPDFRGRREVVVTASARAAGVSGSRGLPLKPGPVATARFSPAAAVLSADGHGETTLRLAVRDRFENPVRATPAVTAQRGEVLGVEPAGDGAWAIRYRAAAVAERTPARVLAQVGPVRAGADLLLVPPRGVSFLPSAGAVLDLRGRFLGPRLGLAVELPAPLPLPAPLLAAWRVEAEGLGYGADRAGAAGGRADVRAGVLLGGLSVQREALRGPELWASLGAGALLARWGPAGGAAETGLAPAARASVGIGWAAGLATPFLEASILAAGRSPAGAFTAVGLSAGVRLRRR